MGRGGGALADAWDPGSPLSPPAALPASASPDPAFSSEALAGAIASALRQVGVGLPGVRPEGGTDGVGARRPDRTWLLAAAAVAGACLAGLAGVVVGIALAGYLAAPNRAVEVVGAGVALVGSMRAARRGARAVRSRSLRLAGGAALDIALALCAAALAAGMRP